MVLEKELLPYLTWLLTGSGGQLGALPRFFITALVLSFNLMIIWSYSGYVRLKTKTTHNTEDA